MGRNLLTLQDRIDAIEARDSGMPYHEVMERFEISPFQFFRAVGRDLGDLILAASNENQRSMLREIRNEGKRKAELFRMDEEFLIEQYKQFRGLDGRAKKTMPLPGTYLHGSNVETLVHYALTREHPALGSDSRAEVVREVLKLPGNLRYKLQEWGLRGIMSNAMPEGEIESALGVMKIFDRRYQQLTGQPSLFDLEQEFHVHEWEIGGSAPNGYWQDRGNVKKAIYHVLTENHPVLAIGNREQIRQEILNLPKQLVEYLDSLGLQGLRNHSILRKNNMTVLSIIRAFDEVYQEKRREPSLFDLSQKIHVHPWDVGGRANKYWQDRRNVEDAVYHILGEANPDFCSAKREKVVNAIYTLPKNHQKYFYKLGLGSILDCGFKNEKEGPTLALIMAYDRAFQRITGNLSLFEADPKGYVEVVRSRGMDVCQAVLSIPPSP